MQLVTIYMSPMTVRLQLQAKKHTELLRNQLVVVVEKAVFHLQVMCNLASATLFRSHLQHEYQLVDQAIKVGKVEMWL